MPEIIDDAAVREALRSVEDPEAGRVRVEMTMTSPACPVAPYLVDESTAAIRAVAPGGTDVQVELVWEPPWTPERMSPEAQSRFGWSG